MIIVLDLPLVGWRGALRVECGEDTLTAAITDVGGARWRSERFAFEEWLGYVRDGRVDPPNIAVFSVGRGARARIHPDAAPVPGGIAFHVRLDVRRFGRWWEVVYLRVPCPRG